MEPFERWLSTARVAVALAVASGCTGVVTKGTTGDTGAPPATTTDWCSTSATLPTGWSVLTGYVEVTPGDDCPELSSTLTVTAYECCPGQDWKQSCSYVGRREGVVLTGYGGISTADTGPAMDVCEYTAVFEATGTCCGRPLLHEGRALVAGVRRDDGWRAGPDPDLEGLEPDERRRLAEDWSHAARLEHASVASFARFALELLRWGAPAELLAAAQAAGLDEVRHAEACFALASAYAGDALGPAELPLGESVSLSATRADLAEALVREGCIGETLAVLEIAARRAAATDPAVVAVLARIEEDEARHAALAWRTLRWLLAEDADSSVRARVAPLFTAAGGVDGPEVTFAERAHGRVSGTTRRAAHVEGWRNVIDPAWRWLSA